MLFLRTGLPGSGKTLNTIKEIDEEHQSDPKNPNFRLHKDPLQPDLPPRVIYYHGIPELRVDQLKSKWIEFHTPEQWYELPDGCVIVIDEAQGTFGTDVRARVEKVTRFEKHRHNGWDIHIITQHPSLVCSPVRKLVGKHINFIRPYGRTKGVFRHEYEMCIDSPERRTNFKMAQESKIEFDSHYFGLYKSATVHTHKKVTPGFVKIIPLILLLIMIPLGVLGYGFYYIMSSGNAEQDRLTLEKSALSPVVTSVPSGTLLPVPKSEASLNPEQYAEQYKPRIPDIDSSSPRYDPVNKPRDFPRPVCLSSTDPRLVDTAIARGQLVSNYSGVPTACQCYSQQSTRMKTTFDFCMDVVNNGYFDDTRQQPAIANPNARGVSSRSEAQPDGLPRGPAGVSQKVAQRAGNEPTIITDSEYAGRPWRGN